MILEKGIYNEETVGDLEAAIKFYREAVSAAEKTQTLAARAQFRLGQCLMKQQKKEDAIKVFRELTEKFPRQKQWIDKAKQYLPADIELTEATWQDGVRETLVMKLPGGHPLGLIRRRPAQ